MPDKLYNTLLEYNNKDPKLWSINAENMGHAARVSLDQVGWYRELYSITSIEIELPNSECIVPKTKE